MFIYTDISCRIFYLPCRVGDYVMSVNGNDVRSQDCATLDQTLRLVPRGVVRMILSTSPIPPAEAYTELSNVAHDHATEKTPSLMDPTPEIVPVSKPDIICDIKNDSKDVIPSQCIHSLNNTPTCHLNNEVEVEGHTELKEEMSSLEPKSHLPVSVQYSNVVKPDVTSLTNSDPPTNKTPCRYPDMNTPEGVQNAVIEDVRKPGELYFQFVAFIEECLNFNNFIFQTSPSNINSTTHNECAHIRIRLFT